jgi:RNA polymerase sigma-70 factor (ECF subfamily)
MTTTPLTEGTQQQFEQLFQRSHRRAYLLAYRLTGNATDAEDVTQDAYMRAWRCFDRYDTTRSFEGWLFRIITNRVLDLQRRKKRVRMVTLDAPMPMEDSEPLSHEFAAPGSDPQDILLNRIMDEQLLTALTTLPTNYRRALLLCAVEQRSYQEIADTMDCAVGTVRSRIHRGRQMIRRSLEDKSHSLAS